MVKILVVDDESRVRELLEKVLSVRGYDVVTVPDAEQALARVLHEPFDLIVLDVRLGDSSGVPILGKIRSLHGKVSIVVYSGLVTEEIEKALKSAGADEVISKTVDVMQFAERIGNILKAKNVISEVPLRKEEKEILVVDDESGVRRILVKFFKERGYKTSGAASGKEALEIVGSRKISVVLLDICMPGMDGLETLEKIKKIDPYVGVLMITGDQDDASVKRSLELGAYGYVLKPFDLLYIELTVVSTLSAAGDR